MRRQRELALGTSTSARKHQERGRFPAFMLESAWPLCRWLHVCNPPPLGGQWRNDRSLHFLSRLVQPPPTKITLALTVLPKLKQAPTSEKSKLHDSRSPIMGKKFLLHIREIVLPPPPRYLGQLERNTHIFQGKGISTIAVQIFGDLRVVQRRKQNILMV